MEPPWLSCVDDAVTWVATAYPDEGCGLILRGKSGYRFHGCANLAHAHGRCARTFYILDPLELVRAEDRGESVDVIVHSHPDGAATLSDEDVADALVTANGSTVRPLHPGVDYLIISMRARQPDHATLFRFHRADHRFRQVWETSFTSTAGR